MDFFELKKCGIVIDTYLYCGDYYGWFIFDRDLSRINLKKLDFRKTLIG
jgi:hypothetical protein